MRSELRVGKAAAEDLRDVAEELRGDGGVEPAQAALAEAQQPCVVGQHVHIERACALEQVRRLAEDVAGQQDRDGTSVVAHSLGVLARTTGDVTLAAEHFAEADAINTRMKAPFFQARTWVEWADLLLAGGDAA